MSCSKSCKKHRKEYVSKEEITAYWQLGEAVRGVDVDGTLEKLSEPFRQSNDEDGAVCRRACGMSLNAHYTLLHKRAKAIVRIVEKHKKDFPKFAQEVEGFMSRVVLHTLFPVFDYLCWANTFGYAKFAGMDDTYTYVKRMAEGDGKIFRVGVPKGLGVDTGLGHIDFEDTKFICVEDEGLSVMLVNKNFSGTAVHERVEIRKHDGAFDYDKAAMMLILKGLLGSHAVDIIEYVKGELIKANTAHIEGLKLKDRLKLEKEQKKLEKEKKASEEKVEASAEEVDEFVPEDKAEASDGKSRIEKELAPTHTDNIGFYQG